MSGDTRFEPEPFLVVSDLAQLQAFNDPLKIRILRILQRMEATASQLAALTDESESTVSGQVRALLDLRLIRAIDQPEGDPDVEAAYRATARIYDLQPEPSDNAAVMAPVANATLDSVRHDVVTSLTQWPDQRMNFESRRLRMSHARAMEFNDRWIELLAEFWGDPDNPADEDGKDPVMAFAGVWYRFPEEE
jgi:DNA-binding transcriptional ArsR family regulator